MCPNNPTFLPLSFVRSLDHLLKKKKNHTCFIPQHVAGLSFISLRPSSQQPAFISSCTSPELLGHISVKKQKTKKKPKKTPNAFLVYHSTSMLRHSSLLQLPDCGLCFSKGPLRSMTWLQEPVNSHRLNSLCKLQQVEFAHSLPIKTIIFETKIQGIQKKRYRRNKSLTKQKSEMKYQCFNLIFLQASARLHNR